MSVSLASKLLGCALGALALSSLGCAAEAPDASASAESSLHAGAIARGSFKLYEIPDARPNPICDQHTVLTLSNDGGPTAAFRETVSGVCEIHVEPRARDYRLELVDTSCGSTIWHGTTMLEGKSHSVTVIDHRARVCEDIVEASIIVEETGRTEGAVERMFSLADGGPRRH